MTFKTTKTAPGHYEVKHIDLTVAVDFFSPTTEGTDWTGWIARLGTDYTDPLPTKRAAVEAAHTLIHDRLELRAKLNACTTIGERLAILRNH